ncbi:hypothetical protein CONLIGDRAFT_174926 [Coniochaeta ligniaria NRRL 30616]|uniref:Uncharacterized protein n=1 Tax=Coniochaeta ligniaria NRRL 30616 TaxID=1408157 RepID=A0A1J7JVG9_9PEZI|nr:hypothetical protein CONLIGDRAFT_174926 [Coniochaeta ligniaria NRRL 30616]
MQLDLGSLLGRSFTSSVVMVDRQSDVEQGFAGLDKGCGCCSEADTCCGAINGTDQPAVGTYHRLV